jgi:hypothetical protein
MKRIVFVVLATLAIAACKGHLVHNPKNSIPANAQGLPLEQIEGAIIDAAQGRGWRLERASLGHLVATQRLPKIEAVVDIRFNQQSYEIQHKSSIGLSATNGTIHSRYNGWVQLLERDIDARLAALALRRS